MTEKIAAIILSENNTLPFINGVLTNPIKGTAIHKVDASQAQALALAIQSAAQKYDLPIPYFMGSICLESMFDPQCQNGNYGPGESNPSKDLGGYDMGACQLKLKYLVGTQGIASVEEAQAFAFDVDQAVPYMASLLAGKIETAVAFIANDIPATINPDYRNPYVVAALLYNFGDTGGKELILKNPPMPTHATHIAHYEAAFAKSLGLPTVMPSGL